LTGHALLEDLGGAAPAVAQLALLLVARAALALDARVLARARAADVLVVQGGDEAAGAEVGARARECEERERCAHFCCRGVDAIF